MRFLNANARYPGSTHDSIIWQSSVIIPLLKALHANDPKTGIFGDSGYALEPYMIVPFKNYRNTVLLPEEQLFNDVHAKIRCLVERSFGILKGRWR